MKRQLITHILLLILFSSCTLTNKPLTASPTQENSAGLVLDFFGSNTCDECNEIKHTLLYPLLAEFPNLTINMYDIDTKQGNDLVLQYDAHHKVTKPMPQELFFPDTFLTGYDDIMRLGDSLIRDYLNDSLRWDSGKIEELDEETIAQKRKEIVNSKQFWLITSAAIVDGVNPCAIATMIFLISFLHTRKKSRFDTLIIGMSFTLAVYITYFLLGFGVFRIITSLEGYHIISTIIKYLAVFLAGSVAIFSFLDAFNYKRHHKLKEMKLQMPKSVKLQIHRIISGNIKNTHIIIGAFVTGFLVTLLEAVCTGQVYLPAITAMTQSSDTNIEGLIWLSYYCTLFVAPLFGVMVAAYFGLTWEKLSKLTQKNLVVLKLLLGTIMAALTAYLWILG